MDVTSVVFALIILTTGGNSTLGGVAGPMSATDLDHCLEVSAETALAHTTAIDQGHVGYIRGERITKETFRFGCIELPSGAAKPELGQPVPDGVVYP